MCILHILESLVPLAGEEVCSGGAFFFLSYYGLWCFHLSIYINNRYNMSFNFLKIYIVEYSGKFGSTSRGGSLQWARIYNGIVPPNAF